MATEKILSTRIMLKVDELSNWNKSDLILKKGELAFATTAASTGTELSEPVIVVKIGDGEHKFSELTYNFYAKSSDVLLACKTEAGLTAFVNNVIANAGIASDEAMGKLAERVTKLEGDENTAGSVAKAIKDAIDALNLDTTYVKVADISAERTKLAGISEGANKVENVGGGKIKIDGTEVTVYEHPATHTVAEISDFDEKVKAYDYATKTEAQGYADAKDGAIAAAKKAGDDAADALDAYKDEMINTLAGKQGVIPENTYDAYGAAAKALEDAKKYADENDDNTEYHVEYDSVNKKIKLVAGADASKMEIPTDDFIKDGMIQSVAISEDGKNLVITWNTDAGKEATNIALTELVDIMTGVDGTTITVNVSADDKISAEVKAGSITTSHIAANAGIVKTQLHADVQASLDLADSAEQNAKDYTDDQIEGLGLGTMSKETATDYVKKSDATGYDNILTATDAFSLYVARQNYDLDQNAINGKFATIQDKDTGKSMRTVAQEEVASAAGNYATAEQGEKADNAIQSVTSVAGNGIKATTTDNAVTIDWDTDVVFVFDCGNADA